MKKEQTRDVVAPLSAPTLQNATPFNDRLEEISVRLGIAQVILYLGLFAFVILSIVSHTELLTYKNFYYFFKDLNSSAKSVDFLEEDSLQYLTDENQSFTLFRGGLTVAGNSAVTVFSATGREVVCDNATYQNPVSVGSGKYLLTYELGGCEYALYNSYSRLQRESTEYPITGAAVSDSGMYALVLSANDYPSVVELYTNGFSLLNRYSKNGFVSAVAINAKGTSVALLSSYAEDGRYQTELSVYEPGKTAETFSVSVGNAIGLSVTYTASGNLAVVTEKGAIFVNASGKILQEYAFSGEYLTFADNSAKGTAVLLSSSENSAKNHVILFDKNGKVLYNKTVDGNVLSVACYENGVFLLFVDRVLFINTAKGTEREEAHQMKNPVLLAAGENSVFVCSPQKAVYLRFSS